MKQIEKAINAMVIDWSHAATGNRVKWAFISDTRKDTIDMVVAIYRKGARNPYMVIFPMWNAMRNVLNTCNAPAIIDDTKGIIEGYENVNTFKVTGSVYDNYGCSIYETAAAATETTETETTETETTETETTETLANMIRAAITGSTSTAPIIATFTGGRRISFTSAIIDDLKSDPGIIDIMDGNTGEIIWAR